MREEIRAENSNVQFPVFSNVNDHVKISNVSTHLKSIGEKIWPGLALVGASLASRKVSPLLMNRLFPKFRVTIGFPQAPLKMPRITNESIQEITSKANKEILEKHGFEPIVKEVSKKEWQKITKNYSKKVEISNQSRKDLIKQQKTELKNIYGSEWKSIYKSKKELRDPTELKYLEFAQKRRKNLVKESETKIFPQDWKSSLEKLPGWKKTIAKIEENQKNLILKEQDLAKFHEIEIKKNSEAFVECFITANSTAILYTAINSKNAHENDLDKLLNQNVNKLKEKNFDSFIDLQANHIEHKILIEKEKIQLAIQDLSFDIKEQLESIVEDFSRDINEHLNRSTQALKNFFSGLNDFPELKEESELKSLLKNYSSELSVVTAALFGRSFLMKQLMAKIPLNKAFSSILNSKKLELMSLGIVSVAISSLTKAVTSPLITKEDAQKTIEKIKVINLEEKNEKQSVLLRPVFSEFLVGSFSTIISSLISQPVLSDIVNVVLSAVVAEGMDPYTEKNLSKAELEAKVKEHFTNIRDSLNGQIEDFWQGELSAIQGELALFKKLSETIIRNSADLKKEQKENVIQNDKEVPNQASVSFFNNKENMIAFAQNQKPSNFDEVENVEENSIVKTDLIIAEVVLGVLMVVATLAKILQK